MVCTSRTCNNSLLVYYNVHKNMCNDRIPATEKKLKKRSSNFPVTC